MSAFTTACAVVLSGGCALFLSAGCIILLAKLLSK